MVEVSHKRTTGVATSHDSVFRLSFGDTCGHICLPTSHYVIHKKEETSLLTGGLNEESLIQSLHWQEKQLWDLTLCKSYSSEMSHSEH